MGTWQEKTAESLRRWDANADYWDDYIGDDSNRFHREIIVPETLRLLDPVAGQRIIDVGCGNGNFSRRLAGFGLRVEAFDFSPRMIARARERSADTPDNPTYRVVDATDPQMLRELGARTFDSAVSNMCLMDMSDLCPLAAALGSALKTSGSFVFSVMHPCFQAPGTKKLCEETEDAAGVQVTRSVAISRYVRSEAFEGVGIRNQPQASLYFHRPLSVLLTTFLDSGFVLDGLAEPVYPDPPCADRFDWYEIPPALIVRLRNT